MRALRRRLRAGHPRPLCRACRGALYRTLCLSHAGAQVPVTGGGVGQDDLITDAPLEACSHRAADAEEAMDADRAADAEWALDGEDSKDGKEGEAATVVDGIMSLLLADGEDIIDAIHKCRGLLFLAILAVLTIQRPCT